MVTVEDATERLIVNDPDAAPAMKVAVLGDVSSRGITSCSAVANPAGTQLSGGGFGPVTQVWLPARPPAARL